MKKVTQKGHLSLLQSWMRFVFRAMFVPPFSEIASSIPRTRRKKQAGHKNLTSLLRSGMIKKDF